MPIALFLAQLICCLFMTGLIWFVQVVHYPLFARVGPGSLQTYEKLHATRTGWVVFPPMLVELLTATAALYAPLRPALLSFPTTIVLFLLVVLIWATTGLGHVPLHSRLETSPGGESDARTIAQLVGLNWIRTGAWTLRSACLVYALARTLQHGALLGLPT